jgi:uncharacterized protein (DUF362 family)
MEGNGPILGTRNTPGVIVAGADPPSVDATCCRIMEIDPDKIKYLRLLEPRFGKSPIEQIGETIPSVRTRFALIPDLEHLRLKTS